MSALYELRPEVEKFSWLEPVRVEDHDLGIDGFRGSPTADEWPIPRVRLMDDDVMAGRLIGDFAQLWPSCVALSTRGVEVTRDLLERCGELLALDCLDCDYWAFNVLAFADVPDVERSDAEWLAPDRLLHIRRFAPKLPLRAALPPIFKLPQGRPSPVIITQQFLDRVIDANLTGLDPLPLHPG